MCSRQKEKLYRRHDSSGVRTSLDALTARAAQLSGIDLEAPKRVIGKNTIECMKSGIVYSNAALIDGVILRMEEELGEKSTVIANRRSGKEYCSILQRRRDPG